MASADDELVPGCRWRDLPVLCDNLRGIGRTGEVAAAVIAALSASPPGWQDIASLLRLEWWGNHGCPRAARYGDDGEMQCSACATDFLRLPLDSLRACVDERRLMHLRTALQAPPDPSIDCPLCGQNVRQVASATLSLALWQHFNWMHTAPAPPSPEGAAPPPAPREAVRVLAGLRAAAATACEACEAGMRLSESSLHYHDGPGYKGSQSGDTWGVCRKVVAALRAEGE